MSIDPKSLQAQLNEHAESLPELLKHLTTLLQASSEWHKNFTGNPAYLPRLERAIQQGLSPVAKEIISEQQALGPVAQTFSTPSFEQRPKPRP